MEIIKPRVFVKTLEYVPNLHAVDDGLLERYRQHYRNTCTKTNGYIIEINRIFRVLERKLSIYNGNIIVNCEVEGDCLLPEIGQIVMGTLKQSFEQGWIFLVCDCMKVFVPRTGNPTLSNTPIPIEITQTRFQKGRYDCIGRLPE